GGRGSGRSRSLAQLLFEVRPADAVTFAVVPAIVAALAALAASLPGRRAAAMDPAAALRSE
ncbi:MAG: hypothetical protein IRZ00_20330, partial [Gemmatimonadetes bacterium]|nr:hypothetical protein [Gemmatimonadota bacterium]